MCYIAKLYLTYLRLKRIYALIRKCIFLIYMYKYGFAHVSWVDTLLVVPGI